MDDVKTFLKKHKLLVLSTVDADGNPWSSNVYYSTNDDLDIFFISPTITKHIKHLENNPKVSFSIAWYNENDLTDRKAVQGTGICKQIKSPTKIVSLLKNHAKYFPLWKDRLTYENMTSKTLVSRPFVIKPDYIKFWNDELYGATSVKEFELE